MQAGDHRMVIHLEYTLIPTQFNSSQHATVSVTATISKVLLFVKKPLSSLVLTALVLEVFSQTLYGVTL